jgi:hypothetical protein
MPEQIDYAGQFQYELAEIITSNGNKIPIIDNIMKMTIYEDMYRGWITGECLIHNQGAMSTVGPIIGQEYFRLKIKTPTMPNKPEETINYSENVLHIVSMNKLHIGTGTESIRFKFVSGEIIRNERLRVSQKLEGSCSSIVDQMLDKLGCSLDRLIESSAGNKKILAPNCTPFQVINMMKRQAITSHASAPNYMFWESFRGINFRSLDSIYNQPTSWDYHTAPSGSSTIGGLRNIMFDLGTIETYSMNFNDSLMDNHTGLFGSKLLVHDITKKSYSTHTYNYFDNFESEAKLDKGFPVYSDSRVNESGSRISDFPGKVMLAPNATLPFGDRAGKDSQHYTKNGLAVFDPYSPEKWLPRRTSQMEQIERCLSLDLTVPGNTVVSVGNLIGVSLPHNAVVKEVSPPKSDKFFRGSFLVKAIRHEFITDSVLRHTMHISAIKDSLDEELLSSDEAYEPSPDKNGRRITDFYNTGPEDYYL